MYMYCGVLFIPDKDEFFEKDQLKWITSCGKWIILLSTLWTLNFDVETLSREAVRKSLI